MYHPGRACGGGPDDYEERRPRDFRYEPRFSRSRSPRQDRRGFRPDSRSPRRHRRDYRERDYHDYRRPDQDRQQSSTNPRPRESRRNFSPNMPREVQSPRQHAPSHEHNSSQKRKQSTSQQPQKTHAREYYGEPNREVMLEKLPPELYENQVDCSPSRKDSSPKILVLDS